METIKNILKKAIIAILIILLIAIFILVFVKSVSKTGMELKGGNMVSTIIPEATKKDEEKKDKKNEIFINSIILKNLVNNSWNKINAKLFEDDTEDYTLNCSDIYVKNIVFKLKYKDPVVSGITVGTPIEKIRAILGDPDCSKQEDNMIGYKTNQIYIFFYEDEIVVYSNKYFYNTEFESLLFNYFDGQYSGNRTNFVVELRKNFPDFEAEMEGTSVILYSVTRQIKLRLNEDKSVGIYLYSGYDSGDLMKNRLDMGNIEVESADFIEKTEFERKEVLNKDEK